MDQYQKHQKPVSQTAAQLLEGKYIGVLRTQALADIDEQGR